MYSEPEARIFLNHVRELGPIQFHSLLEKIGSAARFLEMDFKDLCAIEVARDRAEHWIRQWRDPKLVGAVQEELAKIARGEFRAITELDPDYPAPLRGLPDRPPVLYVKGEWPTPPRLTLGIVGTRHATPYGLCVAEQITTNLVRKGVVTVSGLASGIDTRVHQATLRESGSTVAVLGHGFQYQFPPENGDLFQTIEEKGTLVSEFPFEMRPDPRHFPRRNRIISGLSRGVLVVEAGERSGALITARYAAEQGRDVFVVPGNVFQPTLRGSHRLIKEGAKLVETAFDVLEEYGLTRSPSFAPASAGDDGVKDANLSPKEKEILKHLSAIPISVDELAAASGLGVEHLAEVLLSLELKGRIQHWPGQRYVTYN
jgi:DNA processing protein